MGVEGRRRGGIALGLWGRLDGEVVGVRVLCVVDALAGCW